MPQMTRTVEELLERTNPIEEIENCSINNIVISSLTRGVVDSRTDEDTKICEVEFSDLLIDCSENVNSPEEISMVESTSSTAFNSRSEMNLVIESEFSNRSNRPECNSIPLEEFECFGGCDPDTVQKVIEVIDCDYVLCETVPKKTNDEKRDNCMTCEKSTQTIEESVQNVTELNNQSTSCPTNEIPSTTLQYLYYLNGSKIAKDVNKLSQLKKPDYEISDEKCAAELVKENACPQNYSHARTWTFGLFHNQSKQPMDVLQPSQLVEMERNTCKHSEDLPDQTIAAIESLDLQLQTPAIGNNLSTSSETSNSTMIVPETRIEQSIMSETLVYQSQISAIGNNSSAASETLNSAMVASETRIEQSIVSDILEYLCQLSTIGNNSSSASKTSNRLVIISETGIEQSITYEILECLIQTDTFRMFCDGRNLKTTRLREALNFLRNIISILDNIVFMNNCLTMSFDGFIKIQHSLQELINLVYESLVEFQFLPSPYILVDNEYTDGKVKFNVQLFGEDIFKNLKSMKKELNGLFREFIAFQKNFKYTSRKLCSVPFEKTLDHEIQSTLDKTIGIYNLICRVFKYNERLGFFKDKIGSETLSEVSRTKEFGDYISILKENPFVERLL